MCGNYLPARDPVRARQVTAALWLVSISVGFGLLSGTVSVTTGLNGHSLSVLAIGLGVLADVTGASFLQDGVTFRALWRRFLDAMGIYKLPMRTFEG
jgi:hypothetical protein